MIERMIFLLLLAGCAFFAAIVASEMSATADPDLPAGAISTPSETLPPPARPEAHGRYDELLTTILARPLFSSTRRPASRGDDTIADSGLSDTRLAGIVIAPGHRIAIFASNGAKPLTVSEGETVSGWRVEHITPREVSLSGPGGTKTLQPKFDPNLAPPPPTSSESVNPPPATVPAAPRPGFPSMSLNRPPPRPSQLRGR
jgi:general secretion pathway protein N